MKDQRAGSMSSMRNESINITLKFLWRHFYGEYILICCVLFKLWSFNTDKMVRVGEVTRRLPLAVVNCELWLWVSKRQNETEAGNEFNLI